MQNQQMQLQNKFVQSLVEIATESAKIQILSKHDAETNTKNLDKAMRDKTVFFIESLHPVSVSEPAVRYLVNGADIKVAMVRHVSHILTLDNIQ